jgi:hypothetical protein
LEADEVSSSNLFLALGKYVERQDENLLTQALVLLFNRVAPFRSALCRLLASRFRVSLPSESELVARSQVSRRTTRGRIVVDMEILRRGSSTPVLLLESKLDAKLGMGQLKRYSSALQLMSNSTRLVVLTRLGIDDKLRAHTPRNTIWLSWPMVAELAEASQRRGSQLERLLLGDFLVMTNLRGIQSIPGMTIEGMRRLSRFSHFAFTRSNRLSYITTEAVDIAFQRIREQRDSAWGSMLVEGHGWRTYQYIYRWDEGAYAVLAAGCWTPRPRKGVREAYITLEVACRSSPKLCVVCGEVLSPSHPKYEKGSQTSYWETWYSAADTRWFLGKPMHEVAVQMDSELRDIGRRFLKSLSKKQS